jgi:hypothetical protein
MIRSLEIDSWLNQLVDRAHANVTETSQPFAFGSRPLRLSSIDRQSFEDLSVALFSLPPEWGKHSSQPELRLLVIPSSWIASPPDFSGTQFGPYGSLALTRHNDGQDISWQDDAWLVTIDIPHGRVLALNPARRTALFSTVTPLAPREIAEFARPLFHWSAILDGNVVIHAGAVAMHGSGLLVTGTGNAGKTTFVRSCIAQGLTFLGDNVIEVSPPSTHNGQPRLWGAYASLKLRSHPIGTIPPEWGQPEWDNDARKDIYVLPRASVSREAFDGFHLRAILTLDSERSGEISAYSSADAFFATAPNSIGQFPYFERQVLTRIRETIAQTPSFIAGRLPYDEIAQHVMGLLR